MEMEEEKKDDNGVMVDMEWCVSLPKIELHAHLNGSIRDSTLLELAKDLGKKGQLDFDGIESTIRKSGRTLKDCFILFDLIHIITTDHATVSRITKEVVEDFAADNVVYLELRTTPKKSEARGMTKRSYIEAVLYGLKAVETVDIRLISGQSRENPELSSSAENALTVKNKRIDVRILLSIDRRESSAAAMETVQLAFDMRDQGVVGIDLSGNPVIGEWSTFLPALKWAKEQGLYVSLHCGEVINPKEVTEMLDFFPDRVGHACCLESLQEFQWRSA